MVFAFTHFTNEKVDLAHFYSKFKLLLTMYVLPRDRCLFLIHPAT
jgi:hypothetical protein